MLRKVSNTTLWVAIFVILVAVQVYSAFGQESAITGTWTNGNVGAIQYQNRVTGSTKPGRGSVFSYKFNANGSYEYVGYMEVSMYNCTTTLFNSISGKYSINGTTLDLDPATDFWKSTNSCSASGNKKQTKTPTKKSIEFVTKVNEYGQHLLCLTEGGGETCYRKDEK